MHFPVSCRVMIFVLFILSSLGVANLCPETLTFKQVLQDGLYNSFDSRIIREEIRAATKGVEEVRADLYPKMSIRFGNEYVHVFNENNDLTSVGDAILTDDASGYKHSLIATAQYTLFDFGVKELNLEHAQGKADIAQVREKQIRMETQIKLLELYTEGLKLQEQIEAMKRICRAREKIFRMTGRLQKAGVSGQDDLGNTALDLARSFSRLEDLRTDFHNLLEKVSFYTQRFYPREDLVLEDFTPAEIDDNHLDIGSNPEIAILDLKIANKRTELLIAKRSKYPVFNLYGDCRQFGSDENSYFNSLTDLQTSDGSITLYVEYPLFDGFKRQAKEQRLYHELAGLRLEKHKKEAELKQEFTMALNHLNSANRTRGHRLNHGSRIDEQKILKSRLADQKQGNPIEFHNQMIKLTQNQLELDLEQIDSAASVLRVGFLKQAGT
ncbi:MAG: TolC family protein [Desulfobacterales bacterium]|nr:TolC family protein [Desulfobacterales bacterium]